jgi:hypothetical protein
MCFIAQKEIEILNDSWTSMSKIIVDSFLIKHLFFIFLFIDGVFCQFPLKKDLTKTFYKWLKSTLFR